MAAGVSYYTLIITRIMARIRHIICAPSCTHSVYIVSCNVHHRIYVLTSLFWGPRTNNNRSLLSRLISSFGSSFNYAIHRVTPFQSRIIVKYQRADLTNTRDNRT